MTKQELIADRDKWKNMYIHHDDDSSIMSLRERAKAAEASLLQARLVIDDPERKVEYGTPEYFLIQRLRAALSTSAKEGD